MRSTAFKKKEKQSSGEKGLWLGILFFKDELMMASILSSIYRREKKTPIDVGMGVSHNSLSLECKDIIFEFVD